MGDFKDFFSNKKNLINILLLGILILAIPIGIILIRQQQIVKSRATNPSVVPSGPNVVSRNGQYMAKQLPDGSYTISLQLTSPLGPPTPATSLSPSSGGSK